MDSKFARLSSSGTCYWQLKTCSEDRNKLCISFFVRVGMQAATALGACMKRRYTAGDSPPAQCAADDAAVSAVPDEAALRMLNNLSAAGSGPVSTGGLHTSRAALFAVQLQHIGDLAAPGGSPQQADISTRSPHRQVIEHEASKGCGLCFSCRQPWLNQARITPATYIGPSQSCFNLRILAVCLPSGAGAW